MSKRDVVMWSRVLSVRNPHPWETDTEVIVVEMTGAWDLFQIVLAGGRVYTGDKIGQGWITTEAGPQLCHSIYVLCICVFR